MAAKKITFTLILLFWSYPLLAQCTSGLSLSTVNAAIIAAGRNGVVNLPAGSCTWASTLSITNSVSLLGAGVGATNITLGTAAGYNTPGIDVNLTGGMDGDILKVDGITFDGQNTAGPFIKVSNIRPTIVITNNKFQNGNNGSTVSTSAIYVQGSPYGVIANNDFDRINEPVRVEGYNTPDVWVNQEVTFQFGTANQLFIEANNIHYSSAFSSVSGTPGWIETGQSGRSVIRFNTYNFANCTGDVEYWDVHGFQSWDGATPYIGQTGTMMSEIYRNTIIGGHASGGQLLNHRGSWGMFFDNTYAGSGTPALAINQYHTIGGSGGSGCTSAILPAPVGYTPEVNNTYIFHNSSNSTEVLMSPGMVGNGCGVSENNYPLGYWNYNSGFNGTVGVGRGTKVTLNGIATCTQGVGFWVTDEGNWNNGGIGGQGRFYKCTATNTWTLYYTPYIYPAPLDVATVISTRTGRLALRKGN